MIRLFVAGWLRVPGTIFLIVGAIEIIFARPLATRAMRKGSGGWRLPQAILFTRVVGVGSMLSGWFLFIAARRA
jgi:hypothetical protein